MKREPHHRTQSPPRRRTASHDITVEAGARIQFTPTGETFRIASVEPGEVTLVREPAPPARKR